MSFYGLNRAALNAGVASFVAGAALVVATSTVEASSTRIVLPSSTVAIGSNAQATGVRNVFGGAGFVTEASGSAFPALLQLQYSDIHVSSQLKATYTNVWAQLGSDFQGTSYITRPGAGTAHSSLSTLAAPYVDVGFASQIAVSSFATADASVQRDGFTTVDRDGYARTVFSSDLSANGLRTALPTVEIVVESYAASTALKTHGGEASIASFLEVSAIASTDMAISFAVSEMTANALLTQYGSGSSSFAFELTAVPTRKTEGAANLIEATGNMQANARLALLGTSFFIGLSNGSANGTIIKPASSNIFAVSSSSANGTYLRLGKANFTVVSAMSGTGYTNIEAPDPDNRTMRRQYVDRVMRRPFVDRVLRRQA